MRKILILLVVLGAASVAGKEHVTRAIDSLSDWVIQQFTHPENSNANPAPIAEIHAVTDPVPARSAATTVRQTPPAMRQTAVPLATAQTTMAPSTGAGGESSGATTVATTETFADWYQEPEECKKPTDKLFVKCVEMRRRAKVQYDEEMRRNAEAGTPTP